MGAAPEDAVVHTAFGEGRYASAGEKAGKCFGIGLGIGAWWGLIGAVLCFFSAMTVHKTSELSGQMPVTLLMCAGYLVVGCLLYGLVGLACAGSDDASGVCHGAGVAIGIALAMMNFLGMAGNIGFGWIGMFGSIWVSRQFGIALGSRVNEYLASVLIVTGPAGPVVTRSR